MSPTVLVVDDNASVRRMVGVGLARAGFRVLEAGTSHDALAHAKEADIILQDPDFRGLLRDLRKRTVASVIAFSADAVPPGYDARIRKPAKIRTIVEVLTEYLPVPYRLFLETAHAI